jgi:hypothetical protein
MGLPMIGKLLGHTQVQTTARHSHLDYDPLKSSAHCRREAGKPAAKVVKLRTSFLPV